MLIDSLVISQYPIKGPPVTMFYYGKSVTDGDPEVILKLPPLWSAVAHTSGTAGQGQVGDSLAPPSAHSIADHCSGM